MVTRHTYATADDLRDYLAGTTYSSGWTADAATLRRVLEGASDRIDLYCGGGTCGPVTATYAFDIGSGNLRDSVQPFMVSGRNAIRTTSEMVPIIRLTDWLIAATTVTAYDGTARDNNTVLTAGYNADYFLMPYNSSPKTILKLNEDTADTLDAGQQTLTILGEWGYTNDTILVTTADAVASTTATSVSVTAAANFGPAQTVLIDSEQMYITSISGNTLTVERGVNGTTAATHSGGANASRYDYPPLIVQACLDIGKIMFRNRDMGSAGTIGGGAESMTTSESEIRSVLMTIADYRATGTSRGVIF